MNYYLNFLAVFKKTVAPICKPSISINLILVLKDLHMLMTLQSFTTTAAIEKLLVYCRGTLLLLRLGAKGGT